MPYDKKVKDLMIPLEDYPHIPYWFTLRQAMAIVREMTIKFEGLPLAKFVISLAGYSRLRFESITLCRQYHPQAHGLR